MLRKIIPIGICGLVLLALGLPAARPALAAPASVTFTVNNTLDIVDEIAGDGVCHTAEASLAHGGCTLRAAVMEANFTTGAGATIIVPAGIYSLTIPYSGVDGAENGDLNFTTPASGSPVITLLGAGAGATIIDAKGLDRVLSVSATRMAAISGVTLRHGFRLGGNGGGVSNNGTLTITDSVIEDNQTDASGGGIANLGTLTVARTTLRANVAFLGGGLWLNNTTTIYASSLYGNSADFGGGIEIFSNSHVLTIVNSTISQNTANTDGGGIDNEGTTFLYNTSVIGNDADHDHEVNGGQGGGVMALNGDRFVVVNTLIAGNTVGNTPTPDDCIGTLEGYGWNLLGDLGGCTFTGNGSASRGLVSLNTIGPLQNNGGPTWTQALLAGSEAIDSTNLQGCVDQNGATLTTDQRGAPRPVGVACDVGAFEYSPLSYLFLPLLRR